MHRVIHIIIQLFRRMSVREQLLLLLFCLTLLVLWSANLLQRSTTWNDARQQAATDLQTQQLLIDREATYKEGLEAALQRVDPTQTFSASQLSGRIDEILRKAQLSNLADIDPVRSKQGEIFNDHNIRVRLARISIAQIVEFNKLLRQETPYINVQKVNLAANRSKPTQIDARYEINSFELIQRK
ncbi:MAG: hypothetical protein ACON39_04580 [Coraliomargaritaceae bacterium]